MTQLRRIARSISNNDLYIYDTIQYAAIWRASSQIGLPRDIEITLKIYMNKTET